MECVCSLCAQVPNLNEGDSDEEGLLPMGSAGAYAVMWGQDLEEAKLKDWAAIMAKEPPSEIKVDITDFYPILHMNMCCFGQTWPYNFLIDNPSQEDLKNVNE